MPTRRLDARTGAYRVRYDEGDEAEAHLARADVRFVACAKTDADVRRALRVAGKKRIQFESANASIDAKDKTAEKAKKSDDVEGTRRTTEAEATTKARTNSNASSPNVVARDDTHVAAPSSSSVPPVPRRHVVSATGGGPRRSVVMFDLIAELLSGAGAHGMTFAEIVVALRNPDGPFLERLGNRLTCPAATNSIAGCISHNASLFHKVAPGRTRARGFGRRATRASVSRRRSSPRPPARGNIPALRPADFPGRLSSSPR